MASNVGIYGLGKAVPGRVLTNKDLESLVDTSDQWITTRTGIKQRYIAEPETAASDLGYAAALQALADAKVPAAEIDLIIVATTTPDMPFPATACIIQDRLNARNAAAFDVSAACSGFMYGIEIGQAMMALGYKRVLVIGVDVISRLIDYEDRSTCVLFGDGAGAVVLGPVKPEYGFVASEIGADGSGAMLLHVPAGGSRIPAQIASIEAKQHYVRMYGREVYKFAVRIVCESAERVLNKAGITADAVRWFVPHQANVRIIEAAAQRLGIEPGRVYINVDRYGNTSAASVPIALAELAEAGLAEEGALILLVGFGAGLTWGSAVLRWGGYSK
ncbi:MAG: ketoacyl-ACP synthase III [Firmicutes bacterium]|nr:beta-ketoacyl-ACP synthase III [Bacillota bacterium]NLL88131.1 ketoacyl-ACP synthase III [Bacillota bacterium]